MVNLTRVMLVGTFVDPDGDPLAGRITFTPSFDVLTDPDENVIVDNTTLSVQLDAGGSFAVELPATNAPDTTPSGTWVWKVVEPTGRSYNISLDYATPGGVAQLEDLAAVPLPGTGAVASRRIRESLDYDDTAPPTTGQAITWNGSKFAPAAPSGGGGLTAEQVRDTIGAALVGGSNVTVTVDDPGDTITIAGAATYTDEQAIEAVAGAAPAAWLPAPSGDATGVADTAAIVAVINEIAGNGGGRVIAQPHQIYDVAPSTSQTALGPSGSSSARSICIPIPSGVVLDMNGSTLRLQGSTEAWIVGPALTDGSQRNTDLGLVNAVLDSQNKEIANHPALVFCYCDRLVLDNVTITNARYQGGWVFDTTHSYFDRIDARNVTGQAWTFGDPRATGTGHNQVYDSTFGVLTASAIALLNTSSHPGNPYNLVLTRCTIESIRVQDCGAGIKLQQPSADVTIAMVTLDLCGEASALNSGFKIQGDNAYPANTARPTRVRVGTVIATRQANLGLYMFHAQDCAVDNYIGDSNVLLHTANSDVFLSGGIRDYIGRIDSVNSRGGGVRINDAAGAGPTGYRLPDVRVTNCGQNAGGSIRSAVRVDSAANGTIGRLTAVDDQSSKTMTHAVHVLNASAVGSIATLVSSGSTTAEFISNAPGFPHPANGKMQLTSGEEIVPRDLMTVGSLALATGALRLNFFECRKTELTTGVRIVSGSTAAGATPTLVRISLYEIDAAGNGTLVAATANDTALLAATTTVYSKSWTTPVLKTAGRRYAIGVLVVTAATVPSLSGLPSPTTTGELTLDPRLTGNLASQSDLPATFTAGSVGTSFTRFYAALAA